ncbi:DUF7319 domain-containing protein [Halosegnis longus]|uniref:DUF7319 domain-containing protein n=2 Tax=Halosegnis longus TaxID=2216012 RepID=UPI00129E996D|nr:hypothetical protein [Halosegnis longus]
MSDARTDSGEDTVESAIRRVDEAESNDSLSTEELRAQVEAEYDFDDFTPSDMARMSPEEWDAVFDPDSWITGDELLERLEADLKSRVASRDVFARIERLDTPDRLVAYSDEGYAVVYADGSIEGEGTVLRDVKPSVALCSMDDYTVTEPPEDAELPEPTTVPEGSGEFGNLMMQLIAGAMFLSGLILAGGAALSGGLGIISGTIGLLFLAGGFLLFFTVANARLSDRFRAEEYRNRLRAVGVGEDERPEFLPESARETTSLEADSETDDDATGDAAHTGEQPASETAETESSE